MIIDFKSKKKQPSVGDIRYKESFCIFPRYFKQKLYWLEYVTLKYEWVNSTTADPDYWVAYYWKLVDIESSNLDINY